jgi:hypothetical protein
MAASCVRFDSASRLRRHHGSAEGLFSASNALPRSGEARSRRRHPEKRQRNYKHRSNNKRGGDSPGRSGGCVVRIVSGNQSSFWMCRFEPVATFMCLPSAKLKQANWPGRIGWHFQSVLWPTTSTAFLVCAFTVRPVMPIIPIKTATMLTVCSRVQTIMLFIVVLPVSMRED